MCGFKFASIGPHWKVIVYVHLCVAATAALTNRFVQSESDNQFQIESPLDVANNELDLDYTNHRSRYFAAEKNAAIDWNHHKLLFDQYIKEKYRSLQKYYETKNNETAELFNKNSRRKPRKLVGGGLSTEDAAMNRDDFDLHPLKFYDRNLEEGYKKVKLFAPNRGDSSIRQYDTSGPSSVSPNPIGSGHQFHGHGLLPHTSFLDPLFLIATLSFIAFLINNILGLIDRIRLPGAPHIVRARNDYWFSDPSHEELLNGIENFVSNYLAHAADQYEQQTNNQV